jgi:type II pantothenate kinase
MSMIIGYDKGASAVKLVALSDGRVVAEKCVVGSAPAAEQLLGDFLAENGIAPAEVEKIALTGVGAANCCFGPFADRVLVIPEIEATGEGGAWLSGLNEAVVISIGTGTALVLARNGCYTHIGGSGVGSGTLRGLAKKYFGMAELTPLFGLAETGNRFTVDITIGDLFSGTDTLPVDLTASNLAKASAGATEADWASALVTMILEVAGSHAALACNGYQVHNVVITGGITQTQIARDVYDGFTRLYGLNYVIPSHSGFATAIGAARRANA